AWIHTRCKNHFVPMHLRLIKAFMAGLFLSFGDLLLQTVHNDPIFVRENGPGMLVVFPVGLIMITRFHVDLITASHAIILMAT
ncbi:hypothetical protein K437DRAFT_224912, partial [Tilletiaria anomala UBC 951]